MTHRPLVVAVAAFAATVLLPACGGQPAATAVPHVAAFPMAHGQGRALLYVVTNGSLNVYTYPGDSLVGSLGEVGNYLCTDAQGDVFAANGLALDVLVYAHGAVMPKATLQDPTYAGPCSVDPVTGNLAVATDDGNMVIFPHNKRNGWRFAKVVPFPNLHGTAFCAYDPSGNLFVDGYENSTEGFALDELPKGGSSGVPISLDQRIIEPGGVQWVGKYLTVADAGHFNSVHPAVIYQFTISGSTGTKVGSTKLFHSYDREQYWIQGDRVIGAYLNPYFNGVGVWRYPRGGRPLKTFAPQTVVESETVSLP